MRLFLKTFSILFLAGLASQPVLAQRSNKKSTATEIVADTARKPKPPYKGPKPYDDVITSKAKTDEGMFTVHELDKKIYFEIPDSMLRREILVVNRVSKAPAGERTGNLSYAGDQTGQNVIMFEKGPDNNIFLRTISYAEYAKDSTSPMFTAVTNSNIRPIEFAFDIVAFSKDKKGSVVDVTDMINGDNDVFFLDNRSKKAANISNLQKDKSYIVAVRSFPLNIEITAVKTYAASPAAPDGGNLTVELNSSMVMLPRVPMQPRYYDERVGYFTVGYTDFDLNPQGVQRVSLVKRWKLEPKDEDMEKYKRGELVEPKNPIIFYIDPTTPEKWIPYLMQGVTDWQTAFEAAGFKNAIFGKRAPTKAENPDWSIDDARWSAIVYKPSDVANASGPSVADPRSGQIMESHINWYHNVMSLLRNWYFVQASPIDSRARKMVFDDSLMGQLVRFVSSHEVGHTLGLRHNFGSSSSVPVEKLRDKAWVEANGHTPSIMDYARFNYVAQPEDNISEKGIFPRIGDYDKWAIDWGYRLFPEYNSADAEKTKLNQWVMTKLKDKRLWFGDGESNRSDPRNQTEQVGDDAVLASTYGIKNLKRIVPNLVTWTKMPDQNYDNLNTIYNEITGQFNRYNNHVLRSIGGVMKTPRFTEEPGIVYEAVNKADQKNAMDYLSKNLFTTPTWLINNDVYNRTGANALTVIGKLQDNILSSLLQPQTLNNVVKNEVMPGKDNYSVVELLNDLNKGVWTELSTKKTIDIYRRQLQQDYVEKMDDLLNPAAPAPSVFIGAPGRGQARPQIDNDFVDVSTAIRANLTALRAQINASAATATDGMTKIHLKEMSRRIGEALDPKK
ncbi:MAG: zinc-dependent metalloprotease [Ferruginibacter sp.]